MWRIACNLSPLVSASLSSFLSCTPKLTSYYWFLWPNAQPDVQQVREERSGAARSHNTRRITCRVYSVHSYNQPRLLSFLSRPFPCSNFGRLKESPIFGNLVTLNFGSNCAFWFKGCSWCLLNMKTEIKKEILFKARCWDYHIWIVTLWMQPYRLGYSFPKCLYTLTASRGPPGWRFRRENNTYRETQRIIQNRKNYDIMNAEIRAPLHTLCQTVKRAHRIVMAFMYLNVEADKPSYFMFICV